MFTMLLSNQIPNSILRSLKDNCACVSNLNNKKNIGTNLRLFFFRIWKKMVFHAEHDRQWFSSLRNHLSAGRKVFLKFFKLIILQGKRLHTFFRNLVCFMVQNKVGLALVMDAEAKDKTWHNEAIEIGMLTFAVVLSPFCIC